MKDKECKLGIEISGTKKQIITAKKVTLVRKFSV
jgi:hypothetical protein